MDVVQVGGTDEVSRPADNEKSRAAERPYAPSWINRLIWRIERLPGPTWAWYVLTAVLFIPASNAQAWSTGAQAPGEFGFTMTYYAILPVALLGSVAYLDRAASRSARAFRPALEMDDAGFEALRAHLTVIPARPVLAFTLFAPPLTLLSWQADPIGTGTGGIPPLAYGVRFVAESMVGILFLVLGYHTLRQLREVGRAHRLAARVDLFRPAPLYAFAALTTRTAIVLLALMLSSIVADPETWLRANPLLTVPWLVAIVAIGIAAFVLPLRGMHERIALQKARMLDACGARINGARAAFHDAVDAADVVRAEGFAKLVASLVAERDLVSKLPTWPWQAGQIGAVVSAIVLPIALFVITRLVAGYIPS